MKNSRASPLDFPYYHISIGISLTPDPGTIHSFQRSRHNILKSWPAIGNPEVGFNTISLDQALHPRSAVSALMVIAWAFIRKTSDKSPAQNPPHSLERGINTVAHVILHGDSSIVYVDLHTISVEYAALIRTYHEDSDCNYIRAIPDEPFMKQLLEAV